MFFSHSHRNCTIKHDKVERNSLNWLRRLTKVFVSFLQWLLADANCGSAEDPMAILVVETLRYMMMLSQTLLEV